MARIDLIKEFGKEDAETFNKISKGYSMGRKDERADAIDEYKNNVLNVFCTYCNQEACEGGCMGSIQECEEVRILRDVFEDIAEQMKGGAE